MSCIDVGHAPSLPLAPDALTADADLEWSQAQRAELRLHPRLRCAAALPARRADSIGSGERYLITGGLGGLGLSAGALLQEAGCAVVLTSRSGRVPRDGQGLQQLLASLMAERATSLVCDVQDGLHVLAALSSQRVTGMVHAAGVSTNTPLSSVGVEQIATAYAPKALGAAHMHSAAATVSLTAMVALSSVSTFWCRVGQGCYAAANAFLDAHAPARRAQGQAGLSLSLPGVEGMGMGAALGVRRSIQASLMEYDAALAAMLTAAASSTDAVRQLLPRALEPFVPRLADGRNPLFHEVAATDQTQSGQQQPAAVDMPPCPHPRLEMKASQLAARRAQIPPALLATCKARLPAASVEAAIVAMGTFFVRKPRPAGPRLVRLAVSAAAGVARVELCDDKRSNTISHELAADVADAAACLRRHGGLRAVALHGKGAHFSVGVNPYNYSSGGALAPLPASAYSCELLLEGFVQLRALSVRLQKISSRPPASARQLQGIVCPSSRGGARPGPHIAGSAQATHFPPKPIVVSPRGLSLREGSPEFMF